MRRTQIFCEITTLDLSYVVTVKSTVEILKKVVAFSEYMNFKREYVQDSDLEHLFLNRSQSDFLKDWKKYLTSFRRGVNTLLWIEIPKEFVK